MKVEFVRGPMDGDVIDLPDESDIITIEHELTRSLGWVHYYRIVERQMMLGQTVHAVAYHHEVTDPETAPR